MFISHVRNRYTPLHDLKWSASENYRAQGGTDPSVFSQEAALHARERAASAKSRFLAAARNDKLFWWHGQSAALFTAFIGFPTQSSFPRLALLLPAC